MDDGIRWVDHVLGHRAVHTATKAEDVVRRAHPVLTTPTETAFPAGHDLLGDGSIADVYAPTLSADVVDCHDLADELVTRDSKQVNIGWDWAVTPIHRCAVIALEVARADSNRVHFDECLACTRNRHGDLLEAVVLSAVDHNRLHRRIQLRILPVLLSVC